MSTLTAIHRKALAYLNPVVHQIIAETHRFAETNLTPWKGPGAPPGITRAKLTAQLHAEDKVLLRDDAILIKVEFDILLAEKP